MVMGAGILIQQVENNVFVPRIMGDSLNLHPVIVMIGAHLMQKSLAGILGVMLSAPILATRQIWCSTLGIRCSIYHLSPPAFSSARLPPFLQRVFRAWRAFWSAKPFKNHSKSRIFNMSDVPMTVLQETENYSVWQAKEPDGEITYHIELGSDTALFC